MKYRSVCTGIAAETVAWEPLGWQTLSFSEIEPFCCALLKHRYPETPNYGDFTKFAPQGVHQPDTDLLMGGTPCQSFSVAGRRGGLDDPRGNLALEFVRLAQRLRARWVVWENVKGVLSSDNGEAFGSFLGALAECGYGFAYRVFDAQFDGLAQRRQRVFVIGYLGDWRPPAAVLFERESLRRDTAPSREARQEVAARPGKCLNGYAGRRQVEDNYIPISMALNGHDGSGRMDGESETFVVAPLSAANYHGDQVSRELQITTYFNLDSRTKIDGDVARVLKSDTGSGGRGCVNSGAAVRRLCPREWEKLMGLEPDYTLIPYRGKPAADGPRYRAIGNSISVPTLRWIGERIDMVEKILSNVAQPVVR